MRKVLFIGHEVTDFMGPLAKRLREDYGFYIGLFEARTHKRKEQIIKECFDESIPPPIESIKLLPLFRALFTTIFYQNISRFKTIKAAIRHSLKYDFYTKAFKKYELINIQLVNVHSLMYLDFIPKNAKVILTFWGSDLLNTREESKLAVARAVKSVDKIIVHSVEMREILLAKYGRELYDKVQISLLIDDTSRLKEVIQRLPEKENVIKEFKEKFDIEASRKIVTVGHSGRKLDSHLDIIAAIGKIKEKYKEEIFLVLPMTYSFETKEYIEQVEKACIDNSLKAHIIKDYLSENELYELRLASEILIRLSQYDAFSLALSESICSNNIIVSASWLPYGRLKRFNIHYHEVDYYTDTTDKLEYILNHYDEELAMHNGNHEKVMELFSAEDIPSKYAQVYNSL